MPNLVFPSGLSVQRAKTRAKALVKSHQIENLSKALDAIALEEVGKPWPLAMHQLAENNPQGYLMTTADIEHIMSAEPLLTHFGFEHLDSYSDAFYKRHCDCSKEEYIQRFKKNRATLRNALEECQRCCTYLQHMDKIKSVRHKLGSYGLKHGVERYYRSRGLAHGDAYVSNGSFICAAIHMGFRVIRKRPESPNAWICASVNSDILLWEKFSNAERTLSRRNKRRLEDIRLKIGLVAE